MMQPLGPRVLIKRLDQPKTTSQLIEVVENSAKPSQYAVVLAVGKLTDKSVVVGSVIITKDYCGAEVQVAIEEGAVPESAFVIMEDDILALVEGL